MTSDFAEAATTIRTRLNEQVPKLAVVLGSGLGPVADAITSPTVIDYADIPGFPRSTVSGHAGRLVSGDLGGRQVLCLQGRFHFYEGHSAAAIALPVRALKAAGVEILALTNAAGSLRADMPEGSLMLVTDHINWGGVNPLIGENDERTGPRFLDVTQAYDVDLANKLRRAATARNITLHEGVYLFCTGPSFETPAEIRAFRTLGADAVGMSTVPEALAARHCGMRVAAISSITNLAAGMAGGAALDHAHTLVQAGTLATPMQALIEEFLRELDMF
ncbi:MAG: purine-nucleoside phosphorylase [Rhodospirillaceae bacterium]|jgi:purine-nucleoside phosphorylase|nr:purine-nucleoside phosphorylase [Rhodospirillaceae bacterium]MBT6138274.1 purine-nucleoside phosphorylase [Rhodospirillaceae bacterium]